MFEKRENILICIMLVLLSLEVHGASTASSNISNVEKAPENLSSDILTSSLFALEKEKKELTQSDILEMGNNAQNLTATLRQFTEISDESVKISYYEQILSSYPINQRTSILYEQLAIAYRRQGQSSKADETLRRGRNALKSLIEKHNLRRASIYNYRTYFLLSSLISSATDEELAEEEQFYLSGLNNAAYKDVKDIIFDCLAKRLIMEQQYEKAKQYLKMMDDFYQSLPELERSRLFHPILYAEIEWKAGDKERSVEILESYKSNNGWGQMNSDFINLLLRQISSGQQIDWPGSADPWGNRLSDSAASRPVGNAQSGIH